MKTVFYKNNDQGNAHIDHKLLQGKHKLPPAVSSTYIFLLHFSSPLPLELTSFLHFVDTTRKTLLKYAQQIFDTRRDACRDIWRIVHLKALGA